MFTPVFKCQYCFDEWPILIDKRNLFKNYTVLRTKTATIANIKEGYEKEGAINYKN